MPKKDDEFRNEVGDRLKAIRLALGFETIRAFAGDFGVDEDRYTTWEKGKALIGPFFVRHLRDKYGVTSDFVYFGRADGLTVSLHEAIRATQRGLSPSAPARRKGRA